MKKELTELIFILDKSGSMAGLEKDTIGGYNSMLQKQKEIEGDCFITTVLFDDEFRLLHDRISIQEIEPITSKDYYAGGATALLDAMGSVIRRVKKTQKNRADLFKADKILMVIITDGEDNISCEYSVNKIKKMIKKQKEKGWEFVFLGANIDAVKTANYFGIDSSKAQNYHADKDGVELNFEVMSKAVASYRSSKEFPKEWKNEIQSDYEKRKK